MKCLVATARYLLLVDLETHSVLPFRNATSDFYGISWFAGDPRLVVSNSGVPGSPNDDFETLTRSEKGYVSLGDKRTQGFLSAPHQLVCAPDGRVICTNTGRNSIVAVDPERPGHFHEVRLSEGRWDRWDPEETSGDHLNSVFQRDDRLYAIAHRHLKGSRLATLSYPDMDVLSVDPIADLSGLHNVWVGPDGQGLTCASHQGGLADVRTGTILWAAGESIYTRGLAISDDLIIVGESAYAARTRRQYSGSGLWLIDRRTMRTADYIALGPFGGVHEVRLLDVPDHAHHGHTFAGLDTLLDAKPLAAQRAARLNSAQSAYDRKAFWIRYRDVLGGISVDEHGWLAERDGWTCLIAQNEAEASDMIEFEYELTDGDSQSHVSLVVGYQGGHVDTEMTALLVQPFHHTATARLWESAAGEWTSDPVPMADDLPLSGTIRAALLADGLAVSVSGQKSLTIPADALKTGVRPLGVRWSRSRIRVKMTEPG